MEGPVPPPLEQLFVQYRQRRDPALFTALVARTAQPLYHRARRLRADPSEIDDLVQETYLAALTQAEQFDPSRSLQAWLQTILRNKVVAAHRDRRRRRRPSEGSVRSTGATPHDALERREHRDMVRAVLARLPSAERTLLTDYYFSGKTAKAIAQDRGLPPSTVRSQLWRSMSRMRKLLPEGLLPVLLATIGLRRGTSQTGGPRRGPRRRLAPRVLSAMAGLLAGACLLIALNVPTHASPPPSGAPDATAPGERPAEASAGAEPRTAPTRAAAAGSVPPADAVARIRAIWRASSLPIPHLSLLLEPDRPTFATQPGDDLAGAVSVVTDARGRADVPAQLERFRARYGKTVGARDQRSVGAEVVTRVTFTVTLRGRALDAETGSAVAGAEVLCCNHARQPSFPVLHAARTRGDGSFEATLADTLHGAVWIVAPGRGRSPAAYWSLHRVDASSLAHEVALDDLPVRPAAGAIDGVVTAGEHTAAAIIGIYPMRRPRAPAVIAATDAAGAFHVDALAPGGYRVFASLPDGRHAFATVQVGAGTSAIKLPAAEGARIRGRLTDLDDQPLAGWRVIATRDGRAVAGDTCALLMRADVSRPDGSFDLRHVQPGAVRLRAIDAAGTQRGSETLWCDDADDLVRPFSVDPTAVRAPSDLLRGWLASQPSPETSAGETRAVGCVEGRVVLRPGDHPDKLQVRTWPLGQPTHEYYRPLTPAGTFTPLQLPEGWQCFEVVGGGVSQGAGPTTSVYVEPDRVVEVELRH